MNDQISTQLKWILIDWRGKSIVNNNNGERFETYIIKGERGTGIIGLNGAAARKGQVGDELIIMTFVQMTPEEAKLHQPTNLFPDRNNQVI